MWLREQGLGKERDVGGWWVGRDIELGIWSLGNERILKSQFGGEPK